MLPVKHHDVGNDQLLVIARARPGVDPIRIDWGIGIGFQSVLNLCGGQVIAALLDPVPHSLRGSLGSDGRFIGCH